jgi:prepilin-type N-terminal cleavage/methylation domain-containing protein
MKYAANRGFTLFEMVIVLLIITTLAAVLTQWSRATLNVPNMMQRAAT